MSLKAARERFGENRPCAVGMKRWETFRIVMRFIRFHPSLLQNVASAFAHLLSPILTQVLILRGDFGKGALPASPARVRDIDFQDVNPDGGQWIAQLRKIQRL